MSPWATRALALLLTCFTISPADGDPLPAATSPPGVAGTTFSKPSTSVWAVAATNLIINGDLEISTFAPACNYNLSNAAVTAGVAGITAFGGAEEIDYMNNGMVCYSEPAPSGLAKIAIHRQAAQYGGASDEFAFALSEPINAGSSYTVRFHAISQPDGGVDIGGVEIGLSSSPTSFGTSVFTGIPTATGWSLLTSSFLAPVDATHLTVRVITGVEAWIHLDNFSLVLERPTHATASSWGSLKRHFSR